MKLGVMVILDSLQIDEKFKQVADYGFHYCQLCGWGKQFFTDEVAELVLAACKKYDVEISVHAPYYINFAGTNDELLEKSYGYILDCLKYLRLLGGKRCVFHPGTCGSLPRDEAFALLKERTKQVKQSFVLQTSHLSEESITELVLMLADMKKS